MANSLGKALKGKVVVLKKFSRINGHDIKRLATKEESKKWIKEYKTRRGNAGVSK